jgi:hypothetical protein
LTYLFLALSEIFFKRTKAFESSSTGNTFDEKAKMSEIKGKVFHPDKKFYFFLDFSD